MESWQTRRILILGTTYPAHSSTRVETVCTGGIFEDSCEMVRLYPIPHRYLDPANHFHAFQIISARVRPDLTDPRPESYRIEAESIEPLELVKDHNTRRKFLENSRHFCKSVEDLLDRQERDRTSLGIIVPESITDCSIEKRSDSERREWMQREAIRQQQERLFGSKPKPLDFPEAKFFVHWRCDDERCKSGHKMGLHQWGIHELYRKYQGRADCNDKVLAAMHKQLNEDEKDIFLFLGNFRGKMYNFGLMDSYSSPARYKDRKTPSLFRLER